MGVGDSKARLVIEREEVREAMWHGSKSCEC